MVVTLNVRQFNEDAYHVLLFLADFPGAGLWIRTQFQGLAQEKIDFAKKLKLEMMY